MTSARLLAWLFCRRSILRTVRDRECPDRTREAMACLWSHVHHGIAVASLEHECAQLARATEDEEKGGWKR